MFLLANPLWEALPTACCLSHGRRRGCDDCCVGVVLLVRAASRKWGCSRASKAPEAGVYLSGGVVPGSAIFCLDLSKAFNKQV